MKVKVGDKIYDGDVEPVMVILDEMDKQTISLMPKTSTQYCAFPPGMDANEVAAFMKVTEEGE